jgi:subtilisin family serine protease
MKRFSAITAALLLALLASPAPAEHRPDEVVVRFRQDTSSGDQQRFLDEHGARVDGEIKSLRVKKLKLPPGLSVEKAIEKMLKNPRIELAEPNMVVHKTLLPNDEFFTLGNQWGLAKIGAVQAWTATLSGINDAPVTIAILDTGIMSAHNDMAGRLVTGINIVTPGGSTEDDEFHGTFVAGIAGALTNDSTGPGTGGMAGVAWKARLMPVKVLRADGTGDEFGVITGMQWAVAHGARVINMSVGSCKSDGTCAPGSTFGAEAMEAAWNSGVVLVAATGNEGIRGESYPASYPYVVGVGSTTNADTRSAFSNYGGMVDLVAPGGVCAGVFDPTRDIFSASIPLANDYATACGTSASAPFVSGLAAVLFGQNPARTNEEVVRIMESTADPVSGQSGWNEYTGYGRINMYRALLGAAASAPTDNISAYNYPNPFSPALDRGTAFVIRNLQGRSLSVEISDSRGNLLWSKKYTADEAAGKDFYFNSDLRWDGRDTGARMVPNGVYFAVIKAGSSRTVVKVAVVH